MNHVGFIERYAGRGLQRSAKPLLYPKVLLSSCPPTTPQVSFCRNNPTHLIFLFKQPSYGSSFPRASECKRTAAICRPQVEQGSTPQNRTLKTQKNPKNNQRKKTLSNKTTLKKYLGQKNHVTKVAKANVQPSPKLDTSFLLKADVWIKSPYLGFL